MGKGSHSAARYTQGTFDSETTFKEDSMVFALSAIMCLAQYKLITYSDLKIKSCY